MSFILFSVKTTITYDKKCFIEIYGGKTLVGLYVLVLTFDLTLTPAKGPSSQMCISLLIFNNPTARESDSPQGSNKSIRQCCPKSTVIHLTEIGIEPRKPELPEPDDCTVECVAFSQNHYPTLNYGRSTFL